MFFILFILFFLFLVYLVTSGPETCKHQINPNKKEFKAALAKYAEQSKVRKEIAQGKRFSLTKYNK